MHILIAADSFKDALDAPGVCCAIELGILAAMPNANIRRFPLADGGEGTAQILTFHSGGQQIQCLVKDPLFRPVQASYGLSGNGETAFIEMAQASGLQLLEPEARNPLYTTTYGTGELISDALQRGVRNIVLGIGGSATNDGGMGMAAALGLAFLNAQGHPLEPVGKNLSEVQRITGRLNLNARVEVICDVDNPLCGPTGAAQVYAPQKGADEAAAAKLDAGLAHFGELLREYTGKEVAQLPGAGAAGGLGAGAMAFLNAQLRRGIEAVMDYTDFEAALAGIDLVVTGEGKIDRQTLHGKLIKGVCSRAAAQGVPVLAFCGTLEANAADLRELGLLAAFSISNKPQSLTEAIAQTATGLEQTVAQVFRVVGGK